MIGAIWARIRKEPAIVNGFLAVVVAVVAVLVDAVEASGGELGGFIALILAQALGTRGQVSPV